MLCNYKNLVLRKAQSKKKKLKIRLLLPSSSYYSSLGPCISYSLILPQRSVARSFFNWEAVSCHRRRWISYFGEVKGVKWAGPGEMLVLILKIILLSFQEALRFECVSDNQWLKAMIDSSLACCYCLAPKRIMSVILPPPPPPILMYRCSRSYALRTSGCKFFTRIWYLSMSQSS